MLGIDWWWSTLFVSLHTPCWWSSRSWSELFHIRVHLRKPQQNSILLEILHPCMDFELITFIFRNHILFPCANFLWCLRFFWGFFSAWHCHFSVWHCRTSAWHYRSPFCVNLTLRFYRQLGSSLRSSLVYSVNIRLRITLFRLVGIVWKLGSQSWCCFRKRILVAPITSYPVASPVLQKGQRS